MYKNLRVASVDIEEHVIHRVRLKVLNINSLNWSFKLILENFQHNLCGRLGHVGLEHCTKDRGPRTGKSLSIGFKTESSEPDVY